MHTFAITELVTRWEQNGETQNEVRGFVVSIEPPVNFEAEAVKRVIMEGSIESVEPASSDEIALFDDVLLVGSSEERTVIYSHIKHPCSKDHVYTLGTKKRIEQRIGTLLDLMGIQNCLQIASIDITTDV